MSIEDELLQLARDRELAIQGAFNSMLLDPPHIVRSPLRAYLSRQVDYGRIEHTNDTVPQLTSPGGGLEHLTCPRLQFLSGAKLEFDIVLEQHQGGWLVRRFFFHVRFPRPRRIGMVRIHLKPDITWRDPLAVPLCHLHVDGSRPHVPFPVM